MAREIERKFLVLNDAWRAVAGAPRRVRQGYLAMTDKAVMRVRIVDEDAAFITIKSNEPGRSRDEYEYEVPVADAAALLKLCVESVIDKQRYEVPAGDNLTWEVDVFAGDNDGLVIAEIELPDENTAFARPAWIGQEVTEDGRYYNAALSRRAYKLW
ncbi:MAG: CYTH domain-containing protein [Alphaproteobacteria bacterium]|nr:CYTH domain-containing protein [Alphaproteobacteria bacterium]